MPDLQNFSITHLGAANINVPRFTVSAKITDSTTGAVLFDFTGANAITFPNSLSAATQADRVELAQMIANWMLYKKAGLI